MTATMKQAIDPIFDPVIGGFAEAVKAYVGGDPEEYRAAMSLLGLKYVKGVLTVIEKQEGVIGPPSMIRHLATSRLHSFGNPTIDGLLPVTLDSVFDDFDGVIRAMLVTLVPPLSFMPVLARSDLLFLTVIEIAYTIRSTIPGHHDGDSEAIQLYLADGLKEISAARAINMVVKSITTQAKALTKQLGQIPAPDAIDLMAIVGAVQNSGVPREPGADEALSKIEWRLRSYMRPDDDVAVGPTVH